MNANLITEGWVSVTDRLPDIVEDGESDLVLCVGHKGTHPEWKEYELMKWTKLDKPDIMNHKGEWIHYGWSNRWWDRNPDLYEITHWMPLPTPPSVGGN
jgi:hypothetical protein